MNAATSLSKHKFAMHKQNNTGNTVAQFIIQQKYSKRQDKASKYTGIHTFSTSFFSRPIGWQHGRMGKGVVFTTTLIK